MRIPTILCPLLLPACLLACGGGGGGGGGGGEDLITQVVFSTPSRTGTVYSTGTVVVGAELMVVGDNAANETAHAYASFPLTEIADVTAIVRVVYDDAQTSASGTPYASLGELVALSTDLGPSLDAGDFLAPPFSAVSRVLSTASGAGPRTLDLTDEVLALLDAGADRLDLMFRFDLDTDADGGIDAVWLRDAAHADGPGRLLVTLRRPGASPP